MKLYSLSLLLLESISMHGNQLQHSPDGLTTGATRLVLSSCLYFGTFHYVLGYIQLNTRTSSRHSLLYLFMYEWFVGMEDIQLSGIQGNLITSKVVELRRKILSKFTRFRITAVYISISSMIPKDTIKLTSQLQNFSIRHKM